MTGSPLERQRELKNSLAPRDALGVAQSRPPWASMIERAFGEILEGLSLDKLHRVKVTLGASAQMEDRGNNSGDEHWPPHASRARNEAEPIRQRDIAR